MLSEYKESDLLPDFLVNKRFSKSKPNSAEFDDETINLIQSVFFSIINIDPLNISEKDYDVFINLSKIVDSDKCFCALPKIVPYSIYHYLINFFVVSNDENIHNLISRIIVALTNDATDSLLELSNENIISIIQDNMFYFKYKFSVDLYFDIIANFLIDPNQNVSFLAHNSFPIKLLYSSKTG